MAFRKAYLLLPLCLVSAILLNVYAAVDPTGVYRRYLEKLAPMTPPVAAAARTRTRSRPGAGLPIYSGGRILF